MNRSEPFSHSTLCGELGRWFNTQPKRSAWCELANAEDD